MKKFLAMMAFAVMIVMTGCAKSGKVEKVVNYETQPFTQVVMDGVGNIIFTQGSDYIVRLEGDSALISRTFVTFDNGCMRVSQKANNKAKKGLNIYVTAPSLEKAETNGVGSFESTSDVNFDNNFMFESNGVGSIKIKNFTCKTFKYDQEGVGSSDLSIKCQNAYVSSAGVGSCKLEIEADTLRISVDGVGSVKVKGHVKKYEHEGTSFVSKISDKELVVGE